MSTPKFCPVKLDPSRFCDELECGWWSNKDNKCVILCIGDYKEIIKGVVSLIKSINNK